MPKKVLVVNCEPGSLFSRDLALLRAHYGREVSLAHTYPGSAEEHLADCEHMGPCAVYVTSVRDFLALAMEKGFPHIVLVRAGGCMRLLQVTSIEQREFAELDQHQEATTAA